MPRLLMIAPAPVLLTGDRVTLDLKFAEGMAAQVASWDGSIDCLLWEGATSIAFPVECDRAALPFGLLTLPKGAQLAPDIGQAHDLIVASGDMHETLDLAGPGRRPVVYTMEYTHRTRLDILALETSIGPFRRLRRRLWLEKQERRRIPALKAAAAIQSNGYPCASAYGALTGDMHLYLDNRMTLDRYVTPQEQQARHDRIRANGPLRLVYSGRLDPMKGAQDLIPIATQLSSLGFAFHLDIFGDGVLRSDMTAAIARNGLADRVTLHGNVDFATELVPWQRQNADFFVSCHRQGDPSCTYIESMGCGLPIAGYENEMWGQLCSKSGGGWAVPVGDINALAARIATTSRADLAAAADAAMAFAQTCDFQSVFAGRMAHLARVAARTSELRPGP
jgi:colanic acid/amylovoran biosynthesis glycosyltransferase